MHNKTPIPNEKSGGRFAWRQDVMGMIGKLTTNSPSEPNKQQYVICRIAGNERDVENKRRYL